MNNNELKVGLALFGGGNRAAVFHLGVLKWLSEKELLDMSLLFPRFLAQI